MSIELVMPSNHLIFCHPLLLPPSIFPSIRVISNESLHIRWPKYWSFSFSIRPSNEYSGLISFRFDWFDLLAVWGTLKSLLQHHSSKASIFWHSAFFIYHLSTESIIKSLWEIMISSNKTIGNHRQQHFHFHLHVQLTVNKSIYDFSTVALSQKKTANYHHLLIRF